MRPLFIGYTDHKDKLHLTDDDLDTHVHGIGGTRSGKSKFIEHLARELYNQRQGFCLIDPAGFLYDDLVRWLTYIQSKREIVFFNPSATNRIVGLNPFHRTTEDVSVQADRLIQTTVKAWGLSDTDQTARLERWLRCTYHTLLEQGRPLAIAEYLLGWTDAEVRRFVVEQVQSNLIRKEWAQLAGYEGQRRTPQHFDGQVESSRNKLFRFLCHDQVQRIMGLPDNNLDLEDIIENGKILLVNLAPSVVLTQESSRLIGTLLLDGIWNVAKRREKTAAGKHPSAFPLIIDEFQNFLTPDIPLILDQGAKRGLHLFLFHHRLGQLRLKDENIYDAVMTHATTKVVFGSLNHDDATTMVDALFPGQLDLTQVKMYIKNTKVAQRYEREFTYTTSSGEGDEGLREGTADIPMLKPEPYREDIPVLYSLQEVLRARADSLMDQYQRHFFIRRPGKDTMPALTPFVTDFYVKPERMAAYVDRKLENFLTPGQVDEQLKRVRETLEQEARSAAEAAGPRRKPR